MKSIPRLGNSLKKMDYFTCQVTKQFKENFSIRQLCAQWLQPYNSTASESSQLNENLKSKRKKSSGQGGCPSPQDLFHHYKIPCSAAFGCIGWCCHFLVYASAQRSVRAALCVLTVCVCTRGCVCLSGKQGPVMYAAFGEGKL